MAPATPRRCAALCGACLLADLRVAESNRRLSGMELDGGSLAAAGAAAAARELPICKGDIFRTWWQVGAVPTGEIAASGTFCESPCTSDCRSMLEHRDFRNFETLQGHFQISDWGEGTRCSWWYGNQRRKCRVVITDPTAVNEAITELKTEGVVSPIEVALNKASIITMWMVKARQTQPKERPLCGCSFCAASVMPFILAEAGHAYDVEGQNPECVSTRGVTYTCSQFLDEQECSCAMCFGGSDAADERLGGGKPSYLLGFTAYASDVAFAMRDVVEDTVRRGTCGGDCMYDLRDWQGQK